jgi:prepilin signal peptidase PulO-like enzyme (type II secretory pathway)
MGSYLNATVWRLSEEGKKIVKKKKTQNRSICEHCHHKLGVFDLIPLLGWLFLGGKCRYCKKSISWQHPLVELLTALLFVTSWHFWPAEIVGAQMWIEFGLWLVFLVGLLILAIYDLKHLEILNSVVYPMILAVMVWRFVQAIFLDGGPEVMRELSLGLLVGGGFFMALFYISKERWIGGGDVKLGFFFGAWLGPLYSLVALVVGFYSAFVVVIPLLLMKKVGRKQPVPFGPFLILGVIVATLWGAELVDGYSNTLIA